MANVTVAEIAKVFNRTERYIQQLVNAGMPKERHGEYELGRCMQWYIWYLQGKLARHESEDGPSDQDALRGERERARLVKAQADDAELDLAVKRGTLVPLPVFERRMAYMISTARQQLLQMPGRVAPQLMGEDGPTIKQRLTAAVYAALTALAALAEGAHGNGDSSGTGGVAGTDPSGAEALATILPAASPEGERVGGSESSPA